MKIAYCSCIQAFQDALLGLGRRWFNWAPGNGGEGKVKKYPKPNRHRCTACGNEKEIS